MKKNRFKGQSTLEYAFLVAIIAAAMIAMQFYMKRAVEGRAKQAADEVSGSPYDSELMQSSSIRTNVRSETVTESDAWAVTSDEYAVDQRQTQSMEVTKTGSEHLNPW